MKTSNDSKTNKKSNPKSSSVKKGNIAIGSDLSFAAAEAYKLLRTNLIFSVSSDRPCKIIGVTSAIRDEGKTTTCINLAYTLAETGKHVLLVDGDMRLPKISKMLMLDKSPGLSNTLAGLTGGKIPMQKSGFLDTLYVISSGDIPPNPSELFSSKSMESSMNTLAQNFDYIIIDLPPVNIVSDALVVSNLCDGILLVVRQDYTTRQALDDAIKQLDYCKAKILGFVMTRSDTTGKNQRKYNRYYKRYSYHYGYGYERMATAAPVQSNDPVDVQVL